MKVFVYGTLKKGYGNNRLLSEQTFIGEGYTGGFYDMINSGFPVLVPNDNGMVVKGEVWEVDTKIEDTLDNLDALEGEGVMYDRREVKVKMANSDDWVTCWIYIGNPKYWGRRMSDSNVTDARYIKEGYLEWTRT